MKETYEPKPGTVAFRVLAHLQTLSRGAELMTSQIAEALRIDPNGVVPCLEPAVKAGAVFRRQRDPHPRSPLWWSLVDHSKDSRTAGLVPAADGSQKPNGGERVCPVRAGSETPREGANRDVSAGQSHGAGGSASPAGRGTDGAPACGVAPVFHTPPEPCSQHVLKAEAARPDATDRECKVIVSPRVGAMGAGQPADAGPAEGFRCALWSNGVLQIERPYAVGGAAELVLLSPDETRQLVAYLERLAA